MKNMTFRKSLTAAAVAASLGFPALALAQDAQQNAEAEEQVERIQVTGSRILRPNLSQPTPITSISGEELAKFGTPDLGTVLAELPAIGGTATLQGNSDSNGAAGLSLADLRRLGTSRTLTLVNGKRHVGGNPGTTAVDLASIPTAMIDRIEIITGGASAIYGSDAVSGVVNVILKDDYEGFEFNLNGGKSTESVGAENHSFNVLTGGNFANGRGNATFYAGVDRIAEVMTNDLRHPNNYGTISNPENTGEEDGIPDRLTVPNIASELIDEHGVINPFGPAEARYGFDAMGNPVLQPTRSGTNSFAFGYFPDGCENCFLLEDYENIYPELRKTTFASSAKYDLNSAVTLYGDVKYVTTDIEQNFQPDFEFGGYSINVADNPYLDDGLRDTLLNSGQESVPFAKFHGDLGPRSADNERSLYRISLGAKGMFMLGDTFIDYDTYYIYGETSNNIGTNNTVIEGNMLAAIDTVIDPATGNPACRSEVESAQGDGYENPATFPDQECVPYNPFGLGATEAAAGYVSTTINTRETLTQELAGFSVASDSSAFFELPGGPVGFAMGYEYRVETSETLVDSLQKQDVLSSAAVPDQSGEYNVSEGFLEVSAPIIAGMTGVEELTVDGAIRVAEYSHAGSAKAWKTGLMYSPIENVKIRGTYSKAVRAPNIVEAFSPQSPGFSNIDDPCDTDNINDDPDRAANCAALGIPEGFEANDNVSIDLISGGNPNLDSEESTSKTYGVVYTPDFLENVSLTVDYYDIEITDAILSVEAQTIIDNCVDGSSLDDNFCSSVDRDPETNNIELVRSGYINASAFTTSGIDFELTHSASNVFGLDGTLRTSLMGNYLKELRFFEFQNKPEEVNYEAGELGDPELQARLSLDYALGDWAFSWRARYIDRQARIDLSPTGDIPEDLSPAYVGSMTYHDISTTYYANENVAFNVGIRNLMDKQPPAYITGQGGNQSIYDAIGRRAYAGVKVTF